MNSRLQSALPLLLLFALLEGCAGSHVVGSRSQTTEVQTTRVDSRVESTIPLRPLPLVPTNQTGLQVHFSAGIEGSRSSGELQDGIDSQPVNLTTSPSANVEFALYFSPRWSLEGAIAVTTEDLSGVWFGGGYLAPVGPMVLGLHAAGGFHQITSTNTFLTRTIDTTCKNSVCTHTENETTNTTQFDEKSPSLRLAASLQPKASGPWLDLQWAGPTTFARWSGTTRRTIRITTSHTDDDCSFPGFGECTEDRTWNDTTIAEETSPGQKAALQMVSLGAGWVFRGRSNQFVTGLRYHPSVGSVGLTLQWTSAILDGTRKFRPRETAHP